MRVALQLSLRMQLQIKLLTWMYSEHCAPPHLKSWTRLPLSAWFLWTILWIFIDVFHRFTIGLLDKNSTYGEHWISWHVRIRAQIKNTCIYVYICHLSPVTCHLSPVTCHLSLMPTAMDPQPANSPNMHINRPVCKDPKTIPPPPRKKLQLLKKRVLSFSI